MIRIGALAIVALIVIPAAHAMDSHHKHQSEYAGQQSRQIKSLSESDIEQLKAGAGWGLAKAAELNGVPGPLHLLELKDPVALTADQVTAIKRVYDRMNREARELGEKLIAKEHELELRFRENVPNADELKTLLNEIGSIRSSLRFAHLRAHLETPDILTTAQIEKYNKLRGYLSSDDPCDNIPQGHNEQMWKKHNNC